MDPRIAKLAGVLVNYSVQLKKGQLVKIQGETVTTPLIKAVYEEAIKVGAHPYTELRIPDLDEIRLKYAGDAQLKYIPPMKRTEVNKIDALIHIWGSENTRYLAGVDPKRQAMERKAMHPLSKRLFARFAKKEARWVGTQFPTHADAQDADMSPADYEDFVYGAGHIDAADPVKHWNKVEQEQRRLVKILNRLHRIHVRSADTDLKLRVKGRKWISCHGTENFPDGEIFTSPIENSIEGHIRFSYPASYIGRDVEDVRLEFRKGRVVAESAAKNLDYLQAMLNMDRGARSVGEFAIGTNYGIKRFTKNTLFDEKIGGTCHLAVGEGFAESGGKNRSALHWDMVCDLKNGGEIEADGKIIYSNGKFVI